MDCGQEIYRVCVSMVSHRRAFRDLVTIARQLIERVDLPVSALVTPLTLKRLGELKAIGVDTVGVGLDAASHRVFEHTRGKDVSGPYSWQRYWRTVAAARELFGPFRVSCHLIVGIGETDREIVETFCRLRDMDVYTHLFSFYPEPGSAMARRRRPTLVRWRRLQLVKHLLETGKIESHNLGIDEAGRISSPEVSPSILDEAIGSGLPFVTSGCPDPNGDLGCTRPFGSYRPGEPFREFPLFPEAEAVLRVRKELRLGELSCSSARCIVALH